MTDCGADEEGAKRMGQMLAINGTLMELGLLGECPMVHPTVVISLPC
jgi:hypothetical protein